MPDQIKIEELMMFVGTGLKCISAGKELTLCGALFIKHEVACLVEGDHKTWCKEHYTGLSALKPIVRPWGHLIEEIEHNGKQFVPIVELGLCQGAATPFMVFYHYNERQKSRSFGYREALMMAEWHIDIFGWLDRTGEDGEKLAVEMEG